MNDFYLAAIAAGVATLLFLIGVLRRSRDGEHRIWTGLGLACLALTFALVFFTLGNTIDEVGDAFGQLGEEFSNLEDPTVPTEPLPTFPEGSDDTTEGGG